VLAGSNPGNHFDKWVRAENACGVSSYYGKYGYIIDCGGGEFLVYPNPADEYFEININPEKTLANKINIIGESTIRMFDKMGMIVYTGQIKEFPYQIITKNLIAGIYVIQIINGEKSYSVKVIVEH
jgi:hypothetical protein